MHKLIDKIVPHLSNIYKVMVMLITVGVIILMFPSGNQSIHYTYTTGGFWTNDDLYAPFNFVVEKSSEEVAREETSLRQQSLLYYTVDSAAQAQTYANIEASSLSWTDKKQAHSVAQGIFKKGYLETPNDITDLESRTLVILEGNIGSEHSATEFITAHQLEEQMAQLGWSSNNDTVMNSRLQELRRCLIPSIRFEHTRTQLELDSRLSQLNYASNMVEQGELIISKGDYIDAEKAQTIRTLEDLSRSRNASDYNTVNHWIGLAVLCLIAFIALYMFLRITQHSLLDDNRKITFVLLVILLMSAVVAVFEWFAPNWILAAPMCITPILMRVFFDRRVALYIHLTCVIILANLVPNSYEFIFYQIIAGIMALVCVKNFDRSSRFFTVSIIVFLTYSLIYTAGVLSQDTHLANLTGERYLVFLVNAVLTLLAFPLIFLFEKLFGITTALTLLEISSTNTPALRDLSRKAPGTFQHSMQVANIAEDLINEIGGNSLLARVGALYHDIGKTEAPLYFTENQKSGFNPHDNLDNEESARIITQHVRDGIALAKKYHLPNDVTDFIRTHHGTTTTGYFYTKWMMEHPGMKPDLEAFQYAGPAPFSRETAVVMIVDSVEAATKSLKEPTKEDIEQMVNRVIDGKIRDRQLNYCNITYNDITRIRKILTEKFMSIYHVRVAYPVAAPDTTPNTDNK